MRRVLSTMLRVVVRPAETMDAIVDGAPGGRFAAGYGPVALAGGVWALFCAALYVGGHAPTVTLLPLPRAHYYLFQALVVVPLLIALWRLLAGLASRWAGVAAERRPAVATALSYAYATPLLWAFLLPDVVVYGLAGHHAMGKWLLYYAPIAPLWTLLLGGLALRRVGQVSWLRAALAIFGAFLAQASLFGLVLR